MKSQKNKIFEFVQESGFDPNDFKWNTAEITLYATGFGINYLVSQLACKNTNFNFTFSNNLHYWYPSYSPAERVLKMNFTNPLDEQEMFMNVYIWLQSLKREIETPDLWAQFKQYQITSEVLEDEENPNSQFTEEQLSRVTYGIEQIRTYLLKEYQREAETRLINEKLDYLIDSAKKQGRIDWKNIFVSTIISIGTSLTLSPEQFNHVKTVFNAAWNGFIKLIGN